VGIMRDGKSGSQRYFHAKDLSLLVSAARPPSQTRAVARAQMAITDVPLKESRH